MWKQKDEEIVDGNFETQLQEVCKNYALICKAINYAIIILRYNDT